MRAPGRALLLAAALLAPSAAFSGPLDGLTPADALLQVWPGIRDSSEQLVFAEDDGEPAFLDEDPVRVRTVVTRVYLPWLAARVLYLEEFLHDQPGVLRRQLLLRLETETVGARRVRVLPYAFRNGERWRRLNRSPKLLGELRMRDLVKTEGCDLVLRQEGDQFRGGTTGLDCEQQTPRGLLLYVDYRLVVGTDVYWYRRRLLRHSDDQLHEELVGYNWFAPNDTRLFSCRIDYSASGKPSELRQIARFDLHDQGGHVRFTTPDGRKFELSLHTEDWPFASERDALLLVLEQPNDPEPVASSWTEIEGRQVSIDLEWLKIRCGPLVPETGEIES